MSFPNHRLRRLRYHSHLRDIVSETEIRHADLIQPYFVCPGKVVRKAISSMPGNYQLSIDELVKEVKALVDSGIKSVLLFGIPETKDAQATSGYDDNGIVQQACRTLREEVPDAYIITDVCNCEYTDHGHCGILHEGDVLNDETLKLLESQALSHARAGAHMVAPSDMMDGRVAAIRSVLDESGFEKIPIMSYAVKFASSFYGPFREAAESAPQFGDRKSYQMNPANGREAMREAELDIEEGADIIMVKPALSYLDIIAKLRMKYDIPLAAYNVSGEFSMVKAAAEKGWVDGERLMHEILLSIKRAGADIIITYHAQEIAGLIK